MTTQSNPVDDSDHSIIMSLPPVTLGFCSCSYDMLNPECEVHQQEVKEFLKEL